MQLPELRKLFLTLPNTRIVIVLGVASVITMIVGVLYFTRPKSVGNIPATVAIANSSRPTVNALGRLEPKGEVIRISASEGGVSGSRVAQLLVEEGQQVKAGQTIAILDSRDRQQASLGEAYSNVEVAKSRLEKVKAGAKQGEITARQASVARLFAELQGEIKTQDALIERLKAQLRGDITAEQARINRLEAELKGQRQAQQATVALKVAEKRNTQSEVERFETLFQQGVISNQEVNRRRLAVETSTQQVVESQAQKIRTIATLQQQIQEALANREKTIATLQQQIQEALANREKTIATLQQQIQEAKGTLDETMSVRTNDVAIAQAEVNSALATVKRLQAELELAYIRAPKAGKVLKIRTRPGEAVGKSEIAELGETEQMYAVAEIYESDIGKIRPGQTAVITSPSNAFDGKLQGTVERIGLQIAKKDILDTDPTAATDARVIEVKVRLDKNASKQVSNFTNLQVNVEITI